MLIKVLLVNGLLLSFIIIFIGVRKDRFRGGGAMGNALQEFHAVHCSDLT